MSNHTPGPWRVDHFGVVTGGADCATSVAETYVPPRGHLSAAGVAALGEQQEANAHLIAAAPELLHSLERCAFLLEKIADGDHRALQNSLDAAEEARAAIAKATP